MFGVLITIHVLICLSLIVSVLLQSAKGEGLAGAFGGSAIAGTVFGGRGAATFLSKATTVLAIAFMSMCLILTFVRSPGAGSAVGTAGESAVEQAAQQRQQSPPVQQQQTPAQTQQTPEATQGQSQPPEDPFAIPEEQGSDAQPPPDSGQ